MKSISSAMLLGCLALSSAPVHAQIAKPPSGDTLIGQAMARVLPLGFGASTIYETLRAQKFENNVEFSNAWIKAQLAAFDAASPEFKAAVAPMIEGGGDHGLGMRNWLTDQANVAWWDNTVKAAVGEDGYARVVALNAAFPPGSQDYLLTYGYERKYDAGKNIMALNDLEAPGMMKSVSAFTFVELVKFGDPVRRRMFAFYDAFAAGNVTRSQVEAFNAAYVKAGGCAMAATEENQPVRAARYLNALILMSSTLNDLGFKAQ
jgi:hypothetical protein